MLNPPTDPTLKKGDLNEIYDRIDSLAYAIKSRGEQLENISHRVYGSFPVTVETHGQAAPAVPTPLEEIRSRLKDCFHLLESFDHHLETLSRL